MLSRIAESFFWIGRYLERAHATARMVAEHHQLMVEEAPADEAAACALLLDALSLPDQEAGASSDLVSIALGSAERSSMREIQAGASDCRAHQTSAASKSPRLARRPKTERHGLAAANHRPQRVMPRTRPSGRLPEKEYPASRPSVLSEPRVLMLPAGPTIPPPA